MEQPKESEDRFKANFDMALDVISEILAILEGHQVACPIGSFFYSIGKTFGKQMDKVTVINSFISKTAAYWQFIRDRDPEFINNHVLTMMSGEESMVSHIGNINKMFTIIQEKKFILNDGSTTNPELSLKISSLLAEKLDQMWQLLESFVRISIKYVDRNRSPTIITNPDGTTKRKYEKAFYPDLSIKKLVDLWKINLE